MPFLPPRGGDTYTGSAADYRGRLRRFLSRIAPPRFRGDFPPRPWSAAVVSVVPGLGHVYLGSPWRWVLLAGLGWLGLLAASLYRIGTGWERPAFIALFSWHAFVASDAFNRALLAEGRWHGGRWPGLRASLAITALLSFVYAGARPSVASRFFYANRAVPGLLDPGDRLLVRPARTYRRGELVVAAIRGYGVVVDRIIGIPGDLVTIREKTVLVNGTAIGSESGPVTPGIADRFPEGYVIAVPPDRYCVLYDFTINDFQRLDPERFWITSSMIRGVLALRYAPSFRWFAR